MSRRKRLLRGWSLALAAMLAFAMLGQWQLGRMHEKRAMLDAVDAVLAGRRPVPLTQAGSAARARDYDWAAGTGRFADAPAILLDNQQRGGRAGVRVYRLFSPDGGAPLLVELGWLPLPGDRRMPADPRPAGQLRLAGLLAPPPAQGLVRAVPQRTESGDLLVLGLDGADGLAQALGMDALPPRILKLDPDLPLGHARDLDILPNTLPPEKHLGYAVQWFGLALATLAAALLLTFRSVRR